MMRYILPVFLLATPVWAQEKKPAPPPLKVPDSIEIVRDIEYGTGGGRPLKLHLVRPKKTPNEPMPLLVWVHGGGWTAGNKDSGLPRLIPYVERGYIGATIEYRFSQEAPFPAQIEDCKCAIRYLRSKAKEYNLDPNRIGVWGSSAGGHLVSLLGTSGHVKDLEGKGGWSDQSSKVNAVCNFCGPSDFFRIVGKSDGAKGPVEKLFGGSPPDKKDLAAAASPITHINKDVAQFLIVHGDKDTLVPLDQAKFLEEALKKNGSPVRLYVAEGRGHGIVGEDVDRVVREFFDGVLLKKQ